MQPSFLALPAIMTIYLDIAGLQQVKGTARSPPCSLLANREFFLNRVRINGSPFQHPKQGICQELFEGIIACNYFITIGLQPDAEKPFAYDLKKC